MQMRTGHRLFSVLQQDATGKKDTTEQLYEQTEKVVADLKNKWDKTEEKPAYIGIFVVSIVALYIAAGLVNALDNLPIIPGIFKLVGIFVSAWFTYRYLIFSPGALG
jgi:CAAD domains of cyanobacterial aminoacyl-tRNA synthetase